MFVKICGITNEEDALLAVAMGADAVGFVFAASPRQVAATTARDIGRRLPREILTVGVFRDESPQRVVEIVNANGLKGAQLHGHESPSEVAWIRKRVGFVVKAFAADDHQLARLDEYVSDAVLIDASVPGSGQTFDWSIAQNLPPELRVIVAGGLTPQNVGDAIEHIAPWGVDVSTGVESSPGRKDAIKVMRFIEAAKRYDDGAAEGSERMTELELDYDDDDFDADGDGDGGDDADEVYVLDGDRRLEVEVAERIASASVGAAPASLFDFDDEV